LPGPFSGSTWSDGDVAVKFSYPLYKELREQGKPFTGILARFSTALSVAGQGQTERATGEVVSGNYFEVLGVRPALGRLFTSADETAPGANPVAALSYGYWSRHFGNDPAILNKQLTVNGTALTVVGVSQAGFTGVQVGELPDVFVPLTMKVQMTPNWNDLEEHRSRYLALIGRLKPGISREKAMAAMQPAVHALLELEWPLMKMRDTQKGEFTARKLELNEGAHGRPIVQHDAGQPLRFLMGMVALVLLVACANLASLLVARAEARQREIAIRLALGAGRRRLVRQLLTESLLLAIAGGAAGIAVASWTLSTIVRSIPDSIGVLGIHPQLDRRVLVFALVLSIVTGIIFGLAPSLRASRADVQSTLKDQGTSVSGSSANVRMRKWLIISQVAVTAVLLCGAGLFTRSLTKLRGVNLGMRTDHVIQFSVAPELNRYTPEQTIALFDRMRMGIGALPGVRGVSAAMIPVLADTDSNGNVTIEGYGQGDEHIEVTWNWVGPGYFSTMGIPLLAGREVNGSDTAKSPPVAVINETMARRYFNNRNPIGMHFARGSGNKVHPDIEIVGVVRDSKNTNVREEPRNCAYFPYAQNKTLGDATFYVRTMQEPATMGETLRQTVAGYDASLPVYGMKTLVEQAGETMFSDKLVATLSLFLGVLAALLAAIGLYGVMAYSVARRTREIGIRMALGATREKIAWQVLREASRMTVWGIVLGLPAAYGVGRLIQSLLFGVKASDPLVFVLTAALLATVALFSSTLPTRKAASVDPMVALRYE
jgi:putative ABC transport system permease protein